VSGWYKLINLHVTLLKNVLDDSLQMPCANLLIEIKAALGNLRSVEIYLLLKFMFYSVGIYLKMFDGDDNDA